MDRFNYIERDEPKIFSRCFACNGPIYEGDEYIRHYERVCCDRRQCIIKTTDCELLIAGEEDEM